MFGILKLLAGNAARKPAAIPFPGQVPAPAGLRGLVRIEPANCLACGICSYVCVSAAITGADRDGAYAWAYDPGRCTFCARCADRCPGHALTLVPEPPPAYQSRHELDLQARVPFPACPDCGRPTRILTREWLDKAFAQADDTTRGLLRLCPRCRRHRLQESMKSAMGGLR